MIELKFNPSDIIKDLKFESLLKNKIINNNSYEYKILYVYLLLGLYSYQNMMGEIDNINLLYKQKKTLATLEKSYLVTLKNNKINFETIKNNLNTKFINKKSFFKSIKHKI